MNMCYFTHSLKNWWKPPYKIGICCIFLKIISLRHQNSHEWPIRIPMGFVWSKVEPCARPRDVSLGWQWLWSAVKLTDQFSTRIVESPRDRGKSAGWIPPVFEDFHGRSVRFEAILKNDRNGAISLSTSKGSPCCSRSLGAPPLFKIGCSRVPDQMVSFYGCQQLVQILAEDFFLVAFWWRGQVIIAIIGRMSAVVHWPQRSVSKTR